MTITQNAFNGDFFQEIWDKYDDKFPKLPPHQWYGSTYIENGFVKQPIEQYNQEGFIEWVDTAQVEMTDH